MGFSRKRKITHIFKIMNGVNLTDRQNLLKLYAFVTQSESFLS